VSGVIEAITMTMTAIVQEAEPAKSDPGGMISR
jgi:hypothetical protein